MRFHRHVWTPWGAPYQGWRYGYRNFQARTCERCGVIATRELKDGQDPKTIAPPIPL